MLTLGIGLSLNKVSSGGDIFDTDFTYTLPVGFPDDALFIGRYEVINTMPVPPDGYFEDAGGGLSYGQKDLQGYDSRRDLDMDVGHQICYVAPDQDYGVWNILFSNRATPDEVFVAVNTPIAAGVVPTLGEIIELGHANYGGLGLQDGTTGLTDRIGRILTV